MKKVVITGAKGTIGMVLMKGLTGCEITPIDLPEVDVLDYEKLLNIFPKHDVIIHLAWQKDNMLDNVVMFSNVYRAAIEANVPRIIMASSVHADNFYDWKGPGLLTPARAPMPNNSYGISKVVMEVLGKYYSQHGLEVVCIRFGGVNPEDRVDVEEEGFKKVWLSHRDCVGLVKTCINVESIPNNFVVIYGVSNNTYRIHDYSNPLGWVPKDNAEKRAGRS